MASLRPDLIFISIGGHVDPDDSKKVSKMEAQQFPNFVRQALTEGKSVRAWYIEPSFQRDPFTVTATPHLLRKFTTEFSAWFSEDDLKLILFLLDRTTTPMVIGDFRQPQIIEPFRESPALRRAIYEAARKGRDVRYYADAADSTKLKSGLELRRYVKLPDPVIALPVFLCADPPFVRRVKSEFDAPMSLLKSALAELQGGSCAGSACGIPVFDDSRNLAAPLPLGRRRVRPVEPTSSLADPIQVDSSPEPEVAKDGDVEVRGDKK